MSEQANEAFGEIGIVGDGPKRESVARHDERFTGTQARNGGADLLGLGGGEREQVEHRLLLEAVVDRRFPDPEDRERVRTCDSSSGAMSSMREEPETDGVN